MIPRLAVWFVLLILWAALRFRLGFPSGMTEVICLLAGFALMEPSPQTDGGGE